MPAGAKEVEKAGRPPREIPLPHPLQPAIPGTPRHPKVGGPSAAFGVPVRPERRHHGAHQPGAEAPGQGFEAFLARDDHDLAVRHPGRDAPGGGRRDQGAEVGPGPVAGGPRPDRLVAPGRGQGRHADR